MADYEFLIDLENKITEEDLAELTETDTSSFVLEIIKSFLRQIPTGAAVVQVTNELIKWQYNSFIRKAGTYIYHIRKLSKDNKRKFFNEVSEAAKDHGGTILFDMLQRFDNKNKAEILANLTIAETNDNISINDYFRASTVLERIPYVDLCQLEKYVEDYYDPNSTPLIYQSGAIEETVIDPNSSSKYQLTAIGKILLRYGLNKKIESMSAAKKRIEGDRKSVV